jgi:hypothetical protein
VGVGLKCNQGFSTIYKEIKAIKYLFGLKKKVNAISHKEQ